MVGIAALFILIFIVYPYGIMLQKSMLSRTGSFTFENIHRAIEFRGVLVMPLVNSLSISAWTTLICLIIALPFGYLVAKTDLPFKKLISIGLIVPYILPSYALCMSWVLLLSRNGILEYFLGIELDLNVYGYWPVVLIQAIHIYPFAFILITNAFAQFNQEFFDAGRILGGRKFYILRRLTIPLLAPAILGSTILVFAYAMAEFAPAMLLGGPAGVYVLTTQIWSFTTVFPTDLSLAAILAITLVVCTLVILTLNQTYLSRRRFTTVTGKASRIEIIPLGRWKNVALLISFAFLFVVIIVPLVTLLFGATIDIWGKGYTLANSTLRHLKGVLFEDETYRRSIVNVISLGVWGGVCAVILGILISYFIIRGGQVSSKALNLTAFIPFVIPGIVIGLGLILAFSRPPFSLYGTLWILLVGYVVRFLPIVTSSGTAAFRQIEEELEQAARIFGATWIKTQIKILLPILKNTLIGAWLLVFVSVMKEVSMTSIVWSPGTEVAPVMALIQFSDGHFSEAVSLSFILVIIVIIGTWLAVRLGAVKFVEL
ncbi:MAG: iron ABC transporter permease [Thermodesulfobacteriota bacterium]|nr:iron ABC transporter permease [Thermodesulfobacteriota bacterium]